MTDQVTAMTDAMVCDDDAAQLMSTWSSISSPSDKSAGSARHNPSQWDTLSRLLSSSPVITLSKQVSFLTAVTEAYQSASDQQLQSMALCVQHLNTRFNSVFHPPPHHLCQLLVAITPNGQQVKCEQLVEAVLTAIDSALTALNDKKSFTLVSQSLLCQCLLPLRVSSSDNLQGLIDGVVSRHLFRPSVMKAGNSNHSSLVELVKSSSSSIISGLPSLLRLYLAAYPDHPRLDKLAMALNLTQITVECIGSSEIDVVLQCCHELFTLIGDNRLYHPNDDIDLGNLTRINSQYDIIISCHGGLSSSQQYALWSTAIAAVLQVNGHSLSNDQLVSLFNCISVQCSQCSTHPLIDTLVLIFIELRQLHVLLTAYLSSSASSTVKLQLSGDILSRIPVTQYQHILCPMLCESLRSLSPAPYSAIADLIYVLLPRVPSRDITGIYQLLIGALSACSDCPLDQRIQMYSAARTMRHRYRLAALLPDQICQTDTTPFLSDLTHCPQSLSELLQHSNSVEVLQAICEELQLLASADFPSMDPSDPSQICSLIINSQSVLPDCILDSYAVLLSQHSTDADLSRLAPQLLSRVPINPDLQEEERLRSCLIPHLSSMIRSGQHLTVCDQFFCCVSPSYLNHQSMTSIGQALMKSIPCDHILWRLTASIPTWPLYSMAPSDLLKWITPLPDSALSDLHYQLIRQLLMHCPSARHQELVPNFTNFALDRNDVPLINDIVVSINHHLQIRQSTQKGKVKISSVYCEVISRIVEKEMNPPKYSDVDLIGNLLQFHVYSSGSVSSLKSLHWMEAIIPQCVQICSEARLSPSFLTALSSSLRLFSPSNDEPSEVMMKLLSVVLQGAILPVSVYNALIDGCHPIEFTAIIQAVIDKLHSCPTPSPCAVAILKAAVPRLRRRRGHAAVLERQLMPVLCAISHGCHGTLDAGDGAMVVDLLTVIVADHQSLKLTHHHIAVVLQICRQIFTSTGVTPSGFSRLLQVTARYRPQQLDRLLPIFMTHVISTIADRSNSDQVDRLLVDIAKISSEKVKFYIPMLISHYLTAFSSQSSTPQAAPTSTDGLMALFTPCTRDELLSVHASLDPTRQVIFQRLHKTFLRRHKYYGRA